MKIIKLLFSKLSKINKWFFIIGVGLLAVHIGYTIYDKNEYKIKAYLGDPYAKYYLSKTLYASELCWDERWDFHSGLQDQLKLAQEGVYYSRRDLFYAFFHKAFFGYPVGCFNPSKNTIFQNKVYKLLDDQLSWVLNTSFDEINWIDKEDGSYNSREFASLILIRYKKGNEEQGKQLFDDVVTWCNSFENEKAKTCLRKLREELYKDQNIWILEDHERIQFYTVEIWEKSLWKSESFWERYLSLDDGSDDYRFEKARIALYRSGYSDTEAFNVIKQLAKKNNRSALAFIGSMHHRGEHGFDRNIELAEKYYLRSETEEAHKDLYYLYNRLGKSDDILLYHLERGIVDRYGSGSLYSETEWLADLYLKTKDYVKAKKLYESILEVDDPRKYGKNAEQGASVGIRAAEMLGDIYYQGLGVRQDLEEAKKYYGIACDFKVQSSCDKFREVNEKIR